MTPELQMLESFEPLAALGGVITALVIIAVVMIVPSVLEARRHPDGQRLPTPYEGYATRRLGAGFWEVFELSESPFQQRAIGQVVKIRYSYAARPSHELFETFEAAAANVAKTWEAPMAGGDQR